MTQLSRLALGLTLILTLAGCATTGTQGEKSLILIDRATEVEMGEQTDRGIREEYAVLDDPDLTNYIDEIGQELAYFNERKDILFTFTILDSDIVNAFAAPGGFIYVTTGLLKMADDEAEMACVLAHELGHVTARHSVRALQKAMGVQVLTQLLLGDHEAWQQVAGAGAGLFMMKNSREHEFEADRFAVKYSTAAGYDPEGMQRFFGKLIDLHGTGPEGFQGWLSTHPSTNERVEKVRAEIGKYGISAQNLKRERDRYQLMTHKLRNQEG
jgi:predicted Zn-dependent protease